MDKDTDGRPMLVEALGHIGSTIELLDRSGAPGHIAANLDLAMNQLSKELSSAAGMKFSRFCADDEGCGTACPS